MGFFDTIFIVTSERENRELLERQWFWDRTDAEQFYHNQMQIENRLITLYSYDLRDSIERQINALMVNRHSTVFPTALQELQSNRPALEKEAEWSELEYRPEGYFYIERLKSPDYWPYRAEIRDNVERGFIIFDHTTDQRIATVEPDDHSRSFLVTVNDQRHGTRFTSLKAAVIFAAEEYNGV